MQNLRPKRKGLEQDVYDKFYSSAMDSYERFMTELKYFPRHPRSNGTYKMRRAALRAVDDAVTDVINTYHESLETPARNA